MSRRNAALPPITPHNSEIAVRIHGLGCLTNSSRPRVKMVVGQGATPNNGVSGYGCVTSRPIMGYTANE